MMCFTLWTITMYDVYESMTHEFCEIELLSTFGLCA